MKYVALLRGVNVGGRNKLAMKDLAELCVSLGCCDVVTYIQSGNVILSPPPSRAKSISSAISAEISRRFGLSAPAVLRSATQIDSILASNPFLPDDPSGKSLAVAFLADEPSPEAVAGLDPNRSPGDRFHVTGPDIYLHLMNGFAATKLTNAWFDSKLSTISTARNWNTVRKLADLLAAK